MLTRRSLLRHAGAAALVVAAEPGILKAEPASGSMRLPARADFTTPAFEVCLNNARWHPLSNGARKATEEYLAFKARGIFNQNGHTSPTAIAVKQSFASLIHATPDEIAFVQSTTAAENLVVSALGLTHPGPFNIVTDALHFQGSLFLYTELQKRRIDVRIVKPRGWAIDRMDIERAVDKQTKLIATSHVSWVNGYTHDPKWLADLAHAHGAKLYLDVVQATGVMPIDVRSSGADFLGSASYKWLMGDFGIGFLFARADVLPALERTQWSYRQFTGVTPHALPGDKSGPFPASFEQLHTAAGYFELGSYAEAVLAALSYSLPWIQQIGVANIQQHAQGLNAILRRELPRLGYPCITPEDARAAVISFAVEDADATAAKLKTKSIDVALNPGRMRISPSVYNNERDIQILLEALA